MFLGEGKLNRGREFENVFKFPSGEIWKRFQVPGGGGLESGGTWNRYTGIPEYPTGVTLFRVERRRLYVIA